LKQHFPKELQQNPFAVTLVDGISGKGVISEFMNASGVSVKESECYKIASQMNTDEIHPEVIDILNLINKKLFD